VSYKINETFGVYARAPKLTDTGYEEVRSFGTLGRSFWRPRHRVTEDM
jgi:hypothetical protein